MSNFSASNPVKIGIVGAGAVSDYHHVPGIRLDERVALSAVCDASADLLAARQRDWSIDKITTSYEEICADPEVDAVVIATPNFTHKPIALTAIANGKHVMCEKPLGLNAGEVRELYQAARDRGLVHMTAFTYRFAPSMKYMRHLIKSGKLGDIRHFRSQRFLDLPETSWGWRQYKDKAGAGDLFDMTIHRIDLAFDLVGAIRSVCGAVAQYAPRNVTADGKPCPPSEVDDWSGLIGEFETGAVGVWEGTTLAKGYKMDGFGHEWCEVNGSLGSAVYRLREPNTLLLGNNSQDLQPVEVPKEFLVPEGSPRSATEGDPATIFRYDLMWEFVSAIVEGREATPSFYDGLRAQIVADSVLASHAERRWIDIPDEPR